MAIEINKFRLESPIIISEIKYRFHTRIHFKVSIVLGIVLDLIPNKNQM